jgi:ferric-dicitrate binding protein FerR (iron transport regulator)/Mg-chelatase subunit ChlD/tetratricopeptide (TPR) repeat protein
MPCTQIQDDLAALVDGDDAIVARHADHLASCDDCRDARYEATKLARAVALAGADHVPMTDLAERVLARVPADAAASEPSAEPAPVASDAATTRRGHVAPSAPRTSTMTPVKPAPQTRRGGTRKLMLVLGVGAAAAAAGAIYLGVRGAKPNAGAVDTGPVAGRVLRVEHAAADNEAGLMVRTATNAEWRALRAADPLPLGAQVMTDERTRAWIDLADGSRIAIDHRTQLTLVPAPRGFALSDGRVVADIAHDEGNPAMISTPRGTIDVLGTRFVVTATADLTSVRVTRGAVRLTGTTGAPVEVRAGEEGNASAKTAADVVPAPVSAADVSWAEIISDVDKAATDDATIGLGALRAFRPGESRDKDWALALANHEVKVRIVGPIARTEITETFRNDTDKELEGVYQFPLPPDARIDALSLDDQKGGFEEGAFLDKERAGKIWRGVIDKATPKIKRQQETDLIWVQGPWRDPALLDWKRGGRFELRVFPIPAKGSRTIKLAYTQVVTPHGDRRQYVYPLPHSTDGSTAADKFSVDVTVRGAAAQQVRSRGYDLVSSTTTDPGVTGLTLAKTAFVPQGDLVIDYLPDGGGAEIRAWSYAGNAAVAPAITDADAKKGLDANVIAAQQAIAADARPTAVLALHPKLPRWRESRPRDYVFVVDASQSMVGERATRATALIGAAVAELDRRDRFTVIACDSECASLGDLRAPTGTAATDVSAWLGAREPAGASDVVAAVRAGAAIATTSDADREPWVIYVGDGVATTGFRRAADVESAIASSTKTAGVRVTAMAIGGDADTTMLSAVARGGGGSFLAWVPGQRVATAAMAMIETTHGAALRDPTIELPAGLVDAAPTVLPTVRAGEEILIGARVTGEVKGDVILRGTVAGQSYEQRYPLTLAVSTAQGNAFVPRLWASLAIEQLERDGKGEDRARIVAMSQGYGVMSRHTSLLVLESQAMFDAFGVDRARSNVAWTGEEDLEEVAADGAVDFDPAASVAAGTTIAPPAKADPYGGVAQNKPASAPGRGAGGASDGDSLSVTTTTPIDTGSTRTGNTGTDTKAGADKVAAEPAPDAVDKREASEKARDREATKDTKKANLRKESAKKKKGDRVRADDAPPVDRNGRPMVRVRRVWKRVAAVTSFEGVSTGIQAAIAKAEDALAANPDSREKHRALVQALAYGGELDKAIGIAKKWLERDKLDPQALGYLADLTGRKGDRDGALRLTAGMVDLDPDSVALHERMAGAYTRGGRIAQACAHEIALATLQATNAKAKHAGAALRCLRSLGRTDDAALVLRGLPTDAQRVAAEKAATVAPVDPRVAGDLVVTAHWQDGSDLDLSVVTPQGTRVSWLGGRDDVTVADTLVNGGEKLALKKLKKGNYLIEIGRTDGKPSTTPVRGTLEISALGVKRTVAFELTGDRATLGRINVTMQAELRWLDGTRFDSNVRLPRGPVRER